MMDERRRDMRSVLEDVSKWYDEKSSPNNSFKYNRCPICDATSWGEDKMRHNFGCWIPRLQRITNETD